MRRALPALAAFLLLSSGSAWAARPSFTLTIQDHRFSPTELQVPAGQRIELHVVNKDPSAEEFESTDMHREKVVTGNNSIVVYIGPLSPGTYGFFGDFHPQTARGRIVAK